MIDYLEKSRTLRIARLEKEEKKRAEEEKRRLEFARNVKETLNSIYQKIKCFNGEELKVGTLKVAYPSDSNHIIVQSGHNVLVSIVCHAPDDIAVNCGEYCGLRNRFTAAARLRTPEEVANFTAQAISCLDA